MHLVGGTYPCAGALHQTLSLSSWHQCIPKKGSVAVSKKMAGTPRQIALYCLVLLGIANFWIGYNHLAQNIIFWIAFFAVFLSTIWLALYKAFSKCNSQCCLKSHACKSKEMVPTIWADPESYYQTNTKLLPNLHKLIAKQTQNMDWDKKKFFKAKDKIFPKKRNINFSDPAQLYGVVITGKTVWTVLAGSAFSGSICWSPARLCSSFSSALHFLLFLQLYARNQIFLWERVGDCMQCCK